MQNQALNDLMENRVFPVVNNIRGFFGFRWVSIFHIFFFLFFRQAYKEFIYSWRIKKFFCFFFFICFFINDDLYSAKEPTDFYNIPFNSCYYMLKHEIHVKKIIHKFFSKNESFLFYNTWSSALWDLMIAQPKLLFCTTFGST